MITAVLAVSLLLLQTHGIHAVENLRHVLIGISIGVPSLIVLLLSLNVALETPAHGLKEDPNFQYGNTQAVVALIVIILSLVITISSMILHHRYQSAGKSIVKGKSEWGESSEETDALLADTAIQETSVSIDELLLPKKILEPREEFDPDCSKSVGPLRATFKTTCTKNDDMTGDDPQFLRYNLLLLFLCISMFVGAALCIWTLIMDQFSGIYLELVFLDGFLNLGQSLFTFAFFGFNASGFILTLRCQMRKLLFGQEKISLVSWEDLDPTTKALSTMFIKHHIDVCRKQVLKTSSEAMSGQQLVDWLLERGLVLSRQDGEAFGRHLLRARVIQHVDDYLDFYDEAYLYAFKN